MWNWGNTGGSWWWIIILLLLVCGCGGGGFIGGIGGSNCGCNDPCANAGCENILWIIILLCIFGTCCGGNDSCGCANPCNPCGC